MTVVLIIALITAVIFYIKWKLVAAAYISYLICNDIALPEAEQMRTQITWVVENKVRDLFRRP